MANFRIFIEGDGSEKIFLEYFINYINPNPANQFEIITVGGWTKLNLAKNQFIENTDMGGVNIVIFDADNNIKDPVNGGFTARSEKIKEDLFDCSFELFLYPDNKNEGDFESLLEESANSDHKGILECFDNYQQCLNKYKKYCTNENLYNTPLRKSKIYAYVDAFPKSNKREEKFKKGDFFFNDSSIWNFENYRAEILKKFILDIIRNP